MTLSEVDIYLRNLKSQIRAIRENIVESIKDIIELEIATHPSVWTEHAESLIYNFVDTYQYTDDITKFVQEELDPIINGTTLDPRKLETFNKDAIIRIKNKISTYSGYASFLKKKVTYIWSYTPD